MRMFPRLYDFVMTRGERGPVGRWRRSVVAPASERVCRDRLGEESQPFDVGVVIVCDNAEAPPDVLRGSRLIGEPRFEGRVPPPACDVPEAVRSGCPSARHVPPVRAGP